MLCSTASWARGPKPDPAPTVLVPKSAPDWRRTRFESLRPVRPALAASWGQVLEDRGDDAARYVLTTLIDACARGQVSAGARVVTARNLQQMHRSLLLAAAIN